MIIRRIGNDIPIRWVIERDGVAESFTDLTLKVYIQEVGGTGTLVPSTAITVSSNVLSFTWSAADQKEPGTYSLILEEYDDGELVNTVDEKEAIFLTVSTQEQVGSSEAAVFTTDVQGIASAYGSLEELLAAAQAKITSLTSLNSDASDQITALTAKINQLNQLISDAAQYQLTYGNNNAYVDQKYSQIIAQQQNQYTNLLNTLNLLKGSMIEGFEGTISPLAIQAMMAIFGSEQLQYEFIANIDGNNDTNQTYTVDSTYKPVVRTLYDGSVTYGPSEEVVYNGHYYRHLTGTTTGEAPTNTTYWSDLGSTGDDEDVAEIYLPATVVLHHTLGISAVSPTYNVHQFKRWAISSAAHLQMDDDFQGYYIYIKASKTMTADSSSTTDNAGAKGTAQFIITTEGQAFDDGNSGGYYYFLYATVNAMSGGRRVVTTWNGFTSVKPGEITANKFTSTDGTQFVDYDNKSWRVGGDATTGAPFIEWNINGDGVLRFNGAMVQSASGSLAPIPFWRGEYAAATTYYKGDVVSYAGSSYIYVNSTAAGGVTPGSNSAYWQMYASKGADG